MAMILLHRVNLVQQLWNFQGDKLKLSGWYDQNWHIIDFVETNYLSI